MRSIIPSLAVAALLFAAPSALAAPTCLDRAGDAIKCGVQGAMPVGWTLPPAELQARQMAAQQDGPSPEAMIGMVIIIGSLFALIALMPEFDGRRDSDWDEQEGDFPRRR